MREKALKESTIWQVVAHMVMIIGSLLALLPFVLLVIASFTDNQTALVNGYSFTPEKWSLAAYEYIAAQWSTIGRAYLMTILVTVIGTVLSLVITSTFAFAVSNDKLPGHKVLMFLCIFTMLFNGGIVASYYIYSNIFHIRDTIWALIVPTLLMSPFNVVLVKNYFTNSISPSILEAAQIDGASVFAVFLKIVIPLSVPILATVGLMTAIAYWNDWTNGLYYLTEMNGADLFTIQIVLNKINENINFLANNSELAATAASQLPSTTMRMAIAVIGILPIIIAYPFFQRYFVKGITLGGVKE
ncbi:MAG TPA: carbohydrate ABC transporter permease [Candidatus Limivivens intestinipullorum]|uniref:Carbohydrate ABC transporter permease n=1 Tax=Candidatus Limivivens intestinipullorum TaxID=2840858 RepID=A0A9D1EQ83_9FIRM|nr:carbohydrate ABC transporter permease [Candidatus Limivivens intestinipullorum]